MSDLHVFLVLFTFRVTKFDFEPGPHAMFFAFQYSKTWRLLLLLCNGFFRDFMGKRVQPKVSQSARLHHLFRGITVCPNGGILHQPRLPGNKRVPFPFQKPFGGCPGRVFGRYHVSPDLGLHARQSARLRHTSHWVYDLSVVAGKSPSPLLGFCEAPR